MIMPTKNCTTAVLLRVSRGKTHTFTVPTRREKFALTEEESEGPDIGQRREEEVGREGNRDGMGAKEGSGRNECTSDVIRIVRIRLCVCYKYTQLSMMEDESDVG